MKKATILTLQPYESAFGEMLEKAGGLAPLTNALRGFTAVRKGTNITVPFEGKEYKLDVVETQPDEIVTIVGFGREVKLDLLLAKASPNLCLVCARARACVRVCERAGAPVCVRVRAQVRISI